MSGGSLAAPAGVSGSLEVRGTDRTPQGRLVLRFAAYVLDTGWVHPPARGRPSLKSELRDAESGRLQLDVVLPLPWSELLAAARGRSRRDG